MLRGGGSGMAVAFASLGTGLIVGLIFTAFKLPLPAPPVFAGIMGIFGIWAGSQLWPLITFLVTK
ncbi:MAG: XapX domain-containing protein [Verrucomicrobiales bacterium]|jgi:XapX domain-containing protein